MLSVDLINNYDDFLNIEPVWEDLVQCCEFVTIFQLHTWCKVWWNIYGKNKKFYILVVKKNSIPIGLAPLVLTGNSKKRTVEFIGTGNADYADFMIKPEFKKEALECIFNFLLQNKKSWTKISLTQMSERTGSIELLKDVLSKNKYAYRLDAIEQCHAFEYSNNENERKKYNSGLNKHRNLRNSVNFYNKKGLICYESVKDKDLISKKLPELFFFHWRRWEKTFTPSKFLNSCDRDFYYEMTKELCKNANISLEQLSVNGKSIAYVYSFLYKNTVFLYTASFDIFYRKKSPSTILYYYIIESYIKNGYGSIDFMRGGEQYKEKLTNKSYFNYGLNLYNNSMEYKFFGLFKRMKESALGQKFIRNSSVRSIKLRAQAMIREYGLSKAANIAARSVLGKFFQYRQICVYAIAGPYLNLNSTILNTDFVELFVEDVDSIAGFYGLEMNSEKHEAIFQRFVNGSRCFALNYEGLYIALCFVQYFPFVNLDYDERLSLDKNDALLFDMCIIPEFQKDIVKDFFYSSIEKYSRLNEGRCLMLIEKSEHFSVAKSFPANLIEVQRCNSIRIFNKIYFKI